MTASFHRPSPVKAMFVDSLLVTPPSLERLADLLSSARIDCEQAEKDARFASEIGREPADILLEEAEASMGAAYLALQSYRART